LKKDVKSKYYRAVAETATREAGGPIELVASAHHKYIKIEQGLLKKKELSNRERKKDKKRERKIIEKEKEQERERRREKESVYN